MRTVLGVVLVTALLSACGGGSPDRVILAAGTTLVDSGLVDQVIATYERGNPGVQVSVIGEATAQVLELGRSGGAEVLLVHAPGLEEEFVDDGEATSRMPIFESRFLLVGPADRVETYAGLSIVEAFQALATNQEAFVSRADLSGTHVVERELWERAGVSPSGMAWYTETGLGMGLTLQVADQRDAFALAEEGAFLAARDTLALAVTDVSNVPSNPYSVIVVAEASPASVDLAAWLVGVEGTAAIEQANQDLFGRVVYQP